METDQVQHWMESLLALKNPELLKLYQEACHKLLLVLLSPEMSADFAHELIDTIATIQETPDTTVQKQIGQLQGVLKRIEELGKKTSQKMSSSD